MTFSSISLSVFCTTACRSASGLANNQGTNQNPRYATSLQCHTCGSTPRGKGNTTRFGW